MVNKYVLVGHNLIKQEKTGTNLCNYERQKSGRLYIVTIFPKPLLTSSYTFQLFILQGYRRKGESRVEDTAWKCPVKM